ncbi:GIY-YIG nuclease family protein [bacterium]|nr:GIY-YIG nuclease family protein [bacterium]
MVEYKQYYVYILSNQNHRLYIGMTSNLNHRIYQHKNHLIDGFTKRYNIDQLVYFEITEDVWSALNREKQLKKWRREKKIHLIKAVNPEWNDLASDWELEL